MPVFAQWVHSSYPQFENITLRDFAQKVTKQYLILDRVYDRYAFKRDEFLSVMNFTILIIGKNLQAFFAVCRV